MGIEKGSRSRAASPESTPRESAPRSEAFEELSRKIQELEIEPIATGEYGERLAQFRSVWEEIKNMSDQDERTVLEGRYDKRAEEMWTARIDDLERLSLNAPPMDHQIYYRPLAQELNTFSFGDVETRMGLERYLTEVPRYI